MNSTLVGTGLAALCRIVLGSSLVIGLASGPLAMAHGGGGGRGGGGHGGGGLGGGGHMGGGGFGGGRRLGWWRPHGWWVLWAWRVWLRRFLPGFLRLRRTGYGLRLWLRLSGLWYGYGYPGYRPMATVIPVMDWATSRLWLRFVSRLRLRFGLLRSWLHLRNRLCELIRQSRVRVLARFLATPIRRLTALLRSRPRLWPSSFLLPSLGIDETKVSDATGSHIQVARVHAGSPAERAGLQAGDTIVSANGYLTRDAGNLAWVINHHTPNGGVTLKIRKAANGQDATVAAMLH